MEHKKVMIDADNCIGCGMCSKVCVAHNIKVKNKKAEILLDDCLMCGQCTAICPKKAISISGYDTEQIEKGDNIRLNSDDVLEVIRFRRTIRQFRQKEISKEVIEQILEAGRLSHTAKNMPLADLFSPMARNNKIDN